MRDFQKKTDESLDTENKEIVGAINEVSSQCKDIAKENSILYSKIDEILEHLGLKGKVTYTGRWFTKI